MDHLICDFVGFISSLALSALVLISIGCTLAWVGNIFEFRQRRLVFRLVCSIALSIAAAPILMYYAVRLTSTRTTFVIFLLGAVLFYLITLARLVRSRVESLRRSEMAWGILVAGGALLVFAELCDLAYRDQLWVNIATADHVKHVLITDAISRNGLPPVNPSFFLGKSHPTTYYYFWAMVASVFSHVDSGRSAFMAMTAFSFTGLASAIVLYLRLTRGSSRSAVRAYCGLGLLAVTGFDLLPSLYFKYQDGRIINYID